MAGTNPGQSAAPKSLDYVPDMAAVAIGGTGNSDTNDPDD